VFSVPFSKSQIEFDLLKGMRGNVLVSQSRQPLADVRGAIEGALDSPCIVFTDITRACPDRLLVPALLRRLESAGVRDADITLLCGIGMHRPSTKAERVAKLGPQVVARYRVIDNEPQNPGALVDLGVTEQGVPVVVHRAVMEADLVIATGLVEPHQYAGYSGGRKTLDHPGTRLGRIDGNPFHEAVTEAARRAGLRFILNVVLDGEKQVLKVLAGDPSAVFEKLVSFARTVYEAPIAQRYDVVIGGVGYPKDSNLYQASRAASYLFFAPTPVVKPGGYLVIPARCEEGAGLGVGEQRFFAAMRDAPDVSYVLEQSRLHGYLPGQQRAFVMAKVLEKVHVVVVGSERPDVVVACKMHAASTMEQALTLAATDLGPNLNVLVVPHALLTLPVVQDGHAIGET